MRLGLLQWLAAQPVRPRRRRARLERLVHARDHRHEIVCRGGRVGGVRLEELIAQRVAVQVRRAAALARFEHLGPAPQQRRHAVVDEGFELGS